MLATSNLPRNCDKTNWQSTTRYFDCHMTNVHYMRTKKLLIYWWDKYAFFLCKQIVFITYHEMWLQSEPVYWTLEPFGKWHCLWVQCWFDHLFTDACKHVLKQLNVSVIKSSNDSCSDNADLMRIIFTKTIINVHCKR